MHSRLFKPSAWLGFPHDGYPVVSLDQYLEVRESTVNQIDSALSAARHIQSLLTFGVLEAVVEKPVPESTLRLDSTDSRTYRRSQSLA
ncbi:hypothetical protein F5Y04DRAFT_241446 [Hypomontagnella monticulosa]|nr:hypothetical protein F5Y04DRAFT_241446 [Hypomontagnella monticulosa]